MMFFSIFLIILFFYFLRPEYPVYSGLRHRDALEVLRERYARGEIDSFEYEERKLELQKD